MRNVDFGPLHWSEFTLRYFLYVAAPTEGLCETSFRIAVTILPANGKIFLRMDFLWIRRFFSPCLLEKRAGPVAGEQFDQSFSKMNRF